MLDVDKWLNAALLSLTGLVAFFLIVFARNLFLAPVHIFKENRQKIDSLEKEIKSMTEPKLEIEHDEKDSRYYVEEHKYDSQLGGIKNWRKCKIRVHNLSKTEKITDVEAEVESIHPEVLKGRFPLHLRFHDDKISKIINPDGQAFIEVIIHFSFAGHQIYKIKCAENVQQGIETEFDVGERDYELQIKVTGHRAPSESRKFCVGIRDKDNTGKKVWMWPID